MFWVELILVLAIIFLGVRKGGTLYPMFLSAYCIIDTK